MGFMCQRETEQNSSAEKWKLMKWLLPFLGLLSLIWFLLRVIPKPSRASYPCMRVTAPFASTFLVWLSGLLVSTLLLGKARKKIRNSHYLWAAVFMVGAIGTIWFGSLGSDYMSASASIESFSNYEHIPDPANEPIGEPKGYNPGRVVWVHDPDATDWEGPESEEPCWDSSHTDQTVVDSMMSRAIQWLTGKTTDEEAWEALFLYLNKVRRQEDRGYQYGEKIAIKVNLTTCNSSNWKVNKETREKTTWLDKAGDTSPQMILALLRQLVNVVGTKETDISVGDPVSYIPQKWYEYFVSDFPNIQYLDHYSFQGRRPVQRSSTGLWWSTDDANGKLQDNLPVSFAESDYIINFAVLKGHAAGITVCAKNHYGSLIRNPVGIEWGEQKNYYNLHESLAWHLGTPGRDHYRPLVDLMGHRDLDGKTLLYLVDGLYGGYYWEGTPFKWNMPPFNGDWPSSLFASQDPVAIDSVAYDFLREEWPNVVEDGIGEPGSLQGGAQDYLHEAAQADDPPSGTFYDPENDGVAMTSLGVHEHWNNPENKQYSRNLKTGDGIELISSEPFILNCKSDFDEDKDVDGLDLYTFYHAYAVADSLADLDDSGYVDEGDLSVFSDEFGRIYSRSN